MELVRKRFLHCCSPPMKDHRKSSGEVHLHRRLRYSVVLAAILLRGGKLEKSSFLLLSAIAKQVEISKCSAVTQFLSDLVVYKADYGKGFVMFHSHNCEAGRPLPSPSCEVASLLSLCNDTDLFIQG